MRALWSFWTKPYLHERDAIWPSPLHHLLSWILSVETARKHFAETALWTDDEGAAMLVDGIGLRFDSVSTGLNSLEGHDPSWWSLGKLLAYREQTSPFVHIDSDVFLWKPLPERMLAAPLLAQNPEHFVAGFSFYLPEEFDAAVGAEAEGWLPEEWRWYGAAGELRRAECCGIFGGNRVDFIRYYADLAIVTVDHPANGNAWKNLDPRAERNILIEQYLLTACIEYHRRREGTSVEGIDIEYLFPSMETAFDQDAAADAGYTHLIAGAKKNEDLAARLERRVRRDYPEQYERCVEYLLSSNVSSRRSHVAA